MTVSLSVERWRAHFFLWQKVTLLYTARRRVAVTLLVFLRSVRIHEPKPSERLKIGDPKAPRRLVRLGGRHVDPGDVRTL